MTATMTNTEAAKGSSNVIDLFPKEEMQKIQDEKAKRELVDYLRWSLKHEMDPHALYDDPISTFRNTPDILPIKDSSSVA